MEEAPPCVALEALPDPWRLSLKPWKLIAAMEAHLN
jgi:hypothetical protein